MTLHKYEYEEENFLKEIKEKSMLLINKQYEHHDNMNKQENKEVIEDN